ncbi:aspartate ammonia-lyase [Flavobacterium sp. '19STA2R22 D10 B1']|uniref:aspartate ammonia-lyase n=1 Tax=Flavobacterium aerium TaxID=3037261 RepID=UPI00278C5979|nr:aspartate ammonia-lyase [Flavobacterium sp. '19STA2R22 D10 B1']
MAQNSRIEHDFLGEKELSNDLFYGIQTLRAIENFHITGIPINKEPLMIQALGYVKKAAALANLECGVLDREVTDAIAFASDQLIAGNYLDQFVTDMIQGGAGTSVNMNANEVIANIGLEHMGKKKGEYDFLHPNNHVNCSQSTNDAYPTAFRIALYNKMTLFIKALEVLRESFLRKGDEFAHVIKMGRTQLQDAVPMTLGAEFKGFATSIKEDIQRLKEAQALITEINMGATAIGTRINAPQGYPEIVTEYLKDITGLPLFLAEDLIEATSDTGAYVQISGTLKRSAIKISKICNDLRLLSSGPRTGINEINLPALQPGSSIMPGKVNPVIPEVVNQTAYYVIGADVTISMAAEAGQLQLNVMEPVIAYSLFSMLSYMENACYTLESKCINGITANEEVCRNLVMNSIGIVTSLNPILGYEKCSAIAKEALKTGKSVHQIVVEEGKLISQTKWDEIYSLENMINPQFINS